MYEQDLYGVHTVSCQRLWQKL